MLEFVLGVLIGAGAILVWRLRLPGGSRPAAPAPLPAAPDAAAPGDSPLNDPFTLALYTLQRRVQETPRVATPDDLLHVRPFIELCNALSDPSVKTELLMGYIRGEDAILAWASLQALARRPRDVEVERRLLGWLNHFSPWTSDFILRTLEAWNPSDEAFAGRVLVRLGGEWEGSQSSLILEAFLRRAAERGPILLPIDRPESFDENVLRSILENIDSEIAAPVLEQLGEKTGESESWRGGPPNPGVASLDDLGRVSAPGSVTDEGVLPTPSANALLDRLVLTLSAPPARPALVVGDAGVGKSALIRRVTAKLSAEGWTIFEAGAPRLNAGMMYVGMLEARVHSLIQKLARLEKVVWVVPDFHQLLSAGRSSSDPTGMLELILPAVHSGELLILGETRPASLERVLLEYPEVGRRFEIVRVEPMPAEETAALVNAWSADAVERRKVEIPPAIRGEALSLARQYLSSETPPGGVLRLLERVALIASRRAGEGAKVASQDDLIDALVQLTGLSADVLDERRPLDLEAVRKRFESRVVGQTEAVDTLVERLALIKAGVTDPGRPYGVFLFAGGTGTGKTELAKALADYLFGSPDRLQRLDMSELQDASAFERLLGSGDRGLRGGNSLAERVRRQPFCVVLLDEFEKAHGRVWDVFLQVFDDGRLTDTRGDTVDFRHTIIILTSNVGSVSTGDVRLGLVGNGESFSPTAVERAVARTFKPELLNRLDRTVIFRPLTREIMRRILRKELADAFERRGLRRRDWAVEMEESAYDLLVERGFSAQLGARPLKRALERYLLAPLARTIVDRKAPEGDQFLFVRANGHDLTVEFVDPDAPQEAAIGLMAPPAVGNLADIVYEPRGSHAEIETLRASFESLKARVEAPVWQDTKQRLMAAPAEDGFWDRTDRFEVLGRAEYLDRIESSLRNAGSLLERLQGSGERAGYPLNLVRRLAQQLLLLEAAAAEAFETGPRDAFVSITPQLEDGASPAAIEFGKKLRAMYEAWATARGMRWTPIQTGTAAGTGASMLSITGFAAFALLVPEDGLHVLEVEAARGESRRVTCRVRVVAQPATPARDAAALRKQAVEALAAPSVNASTIVRRYREGASPLVRDAARGWRTGRIARVFAGDFDVIPAGE